MKEHPNFYETVKEAMMRLRRTVVLYDGLPYVVLTITNHKPDGIFRIYLDPIGQDPDERRELPVPENYPPEHPGLGQYMDDWLAAHPKSGIIRKQMNSPLFNKYRPYPLGMCNIKGVGAYYLERQPNRKTEQGLIASMLHETAIELNPKPVVARRSSTINVYGPDFRACVVGDYPTPQDCLANLLDPDVVNNAGAFHRDFALVRGPINMMFLAYRHDVVGVLPNNDFSSVRLGREFKHVKESVAGLSLFNNIQ